MKVFRFFSEKGAARYSSCSARNSFWGGGELFLEELSTPNPFDFGPN
jgi:hypothetical protein